MRNINSTRKLSREELKKIIGGMLSLEATCNAKCSGNITLTCTGYSVACEDYSNCSSKDINGECIEYKICSTPSE